MNFLNPIFLFGLFTLSIPIIIHLFNFRAYKTVYFSNVRFLKDIKQETKSKSNLKHLLILLMRLLAIASLVFAFAQPYIPSSNIKNINKVNEIGIYIDNSFSTEAESKYGKISEIAKKRAFQIAEAYPENTKFFFITNDFEQKHQHYVSKEQLKEFIHDTKISPSVKNISQITSKISDFLTANKSKDILKKAYLISDFQKASSNLTKLKNDSNINYILIPLETESVNNLYIDSVWFETPNRQLSQSDVLNVKITNKSDEAFQEMPVKLFLNDTLKATDIYNVEPGESIIHKLTFSNNKTGIIKARVEITDFPIIYDNIFYFNFEIKTNYNVLIISNKNKNKYIDDVFSNIAEVKITYKSPRKINFEELKNYDVVISEEVNNMSSEFIQSIYGFISDGGTFIVFPGIYANFKSYNKLFNKLNVNYITGIDTSKTYAGKINYNADIFRNVFKKRQKNLDLPYFLRRVKFSNQTFTDEEILLFSEKNDKLISSSNIGLGKLYVFSQTADIKSGSLVTHPIWVTMIYNMVFYGTVSDKIYYTIGKNEIVKFSNIKLSDENIIHIVNNKNNFDFIPQVFNLENSETKIFLNNNIKKSGHYFIVSKDKVYKGISFNYNRLESDLTHYSLKEINSIIDDYSLTNFSVMNQKDNNFSEIIKSQNLGKQLWKLFLILSLIFLLGEILFIKFLK